MRAQQYRCICFASILFFLFSCTERQVILQHDNPDNYSLVKDILWASPDGYDLTMDIYTPTSGKDSYPVLIIFHGGGWLINDNSIMDQSSAYIATNSAYVVCNVNYRLLSDKNNTVRLNQIVEDAFGAVLWVKENVAKYSGDASKIAVTGDSAGGHLSAMIVNSGDRLSDTFTTGSTGFSPSYMPQGKTVEQIASQNGLDVQAAILSYGAYDFYQAALDGFERLTNPFWLFGGSLPRPVFGDDFNAVQHPDIYKALSPIYNIPTAARRKLPPQLLTVGTNDSLVTPASVKVYLEKLRMAGHDAKYWEHEGRPHAYLDSGSNLILGISFENDAPIALDEMIRFLDDIFYQQNDHVQADVAL